jgi:hypothetical protein
MVIDGLTYVGIALFAALTAALSTDDAYKYIDEARLFYLRSGTQCIGAVLLALKMFRSTTFSDAKWDAKKAEEKQNTVTATITRTETSSNGTAVVKPAIMPKECPPTNPTNLNPI